MKMKHSRRPLAKYPSISHRSHRASLALLVFSSLMAVLTLMGFTFMLLEINSLSFRGNEGKILGVVNRNLEGGRGRPEIPVPLDLRPFSDPEADINAARLGALRRRCLCGSVNCQLEAEWRVPPDALEALRSAIHSNGTNNEPHGTKGNENSGGGSSLEADMIRLLDDDATWVNEANIVRCPYVIMDLGSNRGDTLQSLLNAVFSSLVSPSSLSPCHFGCDGSKNENNHRFLGSNASYQFDLGSLSMKQRTADEMSKRHDRVSKEHRLDMESYLELHVGRLDGESPNPWMEFQLEQRMEQRPEGREESYWLAMKKLYEDERRRKNVAGGRARPRPERYCFYGVEANPAFTRQLRGLELVVMGIGPGGSERKGWGQTRGTPVLGRGSRPLRHVHFFTETAATSRGGPAELYLDSVSAGHVGSSILDSHRYALMGGKQTARVEGATLTRLLKNVLRGFDPGAMDIEAKREKDGPQERSTNIGRHEMQSPRGVPAKLTPPAYQPGERESTTDKSIKSGGHLILKIDIEGGEYSVLKEALESRLLCNYAKNGNRVDLVVEFHKWVIEDRKQREEFANLERSFYRELSSCGVHLTKMDTSWH